MANEFKNKIKVQLLEAAKDYSKLITRAIVLESDEFVFQKRYVLKFNRANFLHLTGVYSTVKFKPIVFVIDGKKINNV